ncbi:MAG: hypothetical protein UZ22_OP11002000704 [Microgenomates bacterium OLB23]|nr:MAG: hypothetical protein UZ22_OP11002000704 [Microgenomates bacterium OLB23]
MFLSIYMLSNIVIAANASKRLPAIHVVLAVSLVVWSWVFSTLGRSDMYYAYVIIALLYALRNYLSDTAIKKKGLLWLVGCILLLQISQTTDFFVQSQKGDYDYAAYAQSVAQNIPPNSTVLLSSIPDPYFAVVTIPGVTVYEFPALATPIDAYFSLLDTVDYVVF